MYICFKGLIIFSNAEIATAAMALNFRESIQSADPFDLLTSYKVNQPARKSCQVRDYSRNNMFILFYSLVLVKKYMTSSLIKPELTNILSR